MIPDRRTIREDDPERLQAHITQLNTKLIIAMEALDEIARFGATAHGPYRVAAEALAKIRSME